MNAENVSSESHRTLFNIDSLEHVHFLLEHISYTNTVKDLGLGQPDIHTFDAFTMLK